jgi:integrase
MPFVKVEGWSGRVWEDARGTRTYYIREVRGGKRFQFSTECSTLRAALKEHERFDAAPETYQPPSKRQRLELTDQLIEDYRLWCRSDTDSTDTRWMDAKVRYLKWWQGKLDGRAINAVRLADLLALLRGSTSRRDRIVTIKHLYSYLRQTDRMRASDDPTLEALPVPQGRPAQDAGPSKVIPEADYRAVLPLLPRQVQLACRIMAATGCHLSEVIRLVEKGTVEAGVGDEDVLGFAHKGGHTHRVAVPVYIGEAARALKARGLDGLSRETFYKSIKKACDAAGVERWTPGRFRHTFATNAIKAGVLPAEVALRLGHKGTATTLGWYATTAVAPMLASGSYESAPADEPSGAAQGQGSGPQLAGVG